MDMENTFSKSFSNMSMNRTGMKTPGSQRKKKGLGMRSTKKDVPLCKLGQSLQGHEAEASMSNGDRFVSDRSNIDFDLSNYLVSLVFFLFSFSVN